MKKYNKYYCTSKDKLVSGELFPIYFNNAQTVARTKVPEGEDMYRFYKSNEYHSHLKKAKDFTSFIYFYSRKILFRFKYNIINNLQKDLKVLDYGCGNGDFLNFLNQKKINGIGIEKSLYSQKLCRSKGLRVFSSASQLDQSNFNVITLWHVLEHVNSPKKCIRVLSSLLINGGFLVIAVPNIQSTDSQIFKHDWAGLDVPRHLWHFTSKGLVDLLRKEGFLLVRKRPLILDAYYISLLSARRKKIILPWLIAIIIGTLSNIIGLINGNFSSSVFIFKKST